MNHCKDCTYYEAEWAYCFKYGCHVSEDDRCECLITEDDHEQGTQGCTVQPGASQGE